MSRLMVAKVTVALVSHSRSSSLASRLLCEIHEKVRSLTLLSRPVFPFQIVSAS